ncbi:hypothetical protein GCM10018783_02570 [Streptomyces griseosporeus]|uniref:Uncharacterized protein n=1 Tax=Streptomyces actuosus TaxID=1885 RepID=A0A2U9PC10_STRAS|nr:hypothetical protein DMT42_36810 [Streptomyces actuosus]GHF37673.1 hypothetical protein GCM10018783_02570 [Streptomyces griseosporeus]
MNVDDQTGVEAEDEPEWTGVVSQRLRCCVCGGSTAGSEDYVLVELTSQSSDARQWLGAHADHLNSVLADGFSVEVHQM